MVKINPNQAMATEVLNPSSTICIWNSLSVNHGTASLFHVKPETVNYQLAGLKIFGRKRMTLKSIWTSRAADDAIRTCKT